MWSHTGSCNKISSQNSAIWFSSFLQGDGRKCEDIDECAILNGCDPRYGVCENSVGSYICRCKAGFEKKNASNECIGQWHDILFNWNKSFHHFHNISMKRSFGSWKVFWFIVSRKKENWMFLLKQTDDANLPTITCMKIKKKIRSEVYAMSNCVQASKLWSNNMRTYL